MRIVLAAIYLVFGTTLTLAQTQPPAKPGNSPHSTGRTVDRE